MTTLSIIGSGNMAATIGARAAQHGYDIEILSRDAAKARALAATIGDRASVGEYGTRPAGDIVIVAVLYEGAVDAVRQFGDALAGKVLVDITNPFDAQGTGVTTTVGDSITERIAAAAPGAQVVKAFNTIFRAVLASDRALDVLFAGSTPEARALFGAFVTDLGLRPRDVGGIEMAHVLEWSGILIMGVARNGAGFDVALSAEVR